MEKQRSEEERFCMEEKETLNTQGRSELSPSAESGDGRIPGQRICESFARKVLATRFMCILLVPRGGSNPCPRAHIEFPIVERMDVKIQ
jgi:hypothetical protein